MNDDNKPIGQTGNRPVSTSDESKALAMGAEAEEILSVAQPCQLNMLATLAEHDSTIGFLAECTIIKPDNKVLFADFYNLYKAHCRLDGCAPLAKNTLSIKLRNIAETMHLPIEIKKSSGNKSFIFGLSLF